MTKSLPDNKSPIIKAIDSGCADDLRDLLKSGVPSAELTASLGYIIRMLGRKSDPIEVNSLFDMAHLLVKFGAPMDTEERSDTLLTRYAKHNKINELKDYLENNCCEEQQFFKLISAACDKKSEATALMLIDLGREKYDFSKTYLLHDSVDADLFMVAKKLLACDIDINRQDRYGATPLHEAAIFDHPETIVLLLDHGADLFIKDKDGKTPINHIENSDNQSYAILKSAMEQHQLERLVDIQDSTSGLSF